MRNELIPVIEGRFNARVAEALARLADIVRDEDAWLDEQAAKALEIDGRIPADELAKLPPALQRRVLKAVVPQASHEEVERMRLVALEGATGDEVDLGAGLNARLEYGFLLVGPAKPKMSKRRPTAVELQVPGRTDLPAWGWRVNAWFASAPPQAFPDGRLTCALDAERATGPLVWRLPTAGDRFRPLGMAHDKKLGDFFTDAKVPRAERGATPIVSSADGIIWVVGHRQADQTKVTGSTRRVLWLEASRGGES